MTWGSVNYPPRLWEVERRAIRQRIVVVIRRRGARRAAWADMVRRAA